MPDKELIEQIQSGSRDAFRRLVEQYQPMVFNTCLGFVGNRQSAEDLAQDVFIEVHRSIHKFRGDAKLSTWLYRISVNKSLNHIRDHKRHNIVRSLERFFFDERDENLDVEDTVFGTADMPLEQQQHARALHKAINALPDNQQIAFTLHKFDEMSYKEIAEVMDVSLSSVESLIHRAKKNLQKKLVNYYRENFQ
jgi:RNA polymerase sigma-70 factor (ECF subfamily)